MFPVARGKRGYDEAFLSEIPAELTCVICSLVLRDPVQLECGDRFCLPCFNDLVEHSNSSGSDVLCPVDRQVIDKDKIFTDKGVTRTIKSLKVKCKNNESGCEWTGCLGDLVSHEASCQFHVIPVPSNQDNDLKDLCKQLCERVQGCEEKDALKEKELAHLKFTIKEMKENYFSKEEIKGLKEEMIYLKMTVKDMRDDSSKNDEIKALRDSVSQLENKMEILMKESKEIAEKHTNQLEQLRKKNVNLETKLKSKVSSVETKICCKKGSKTCTCIETNEKYTNQQITLFEEKFEKKKIEQSIQMISDKVKNLDGQLVIFHRGSLSNRVNLIRVCKSLDENTNWMKHKIKDLENLVNCVENVLFLFNSMENREVEFKWIMDNFKERFEIGKPVFSPVFYTQIVGYCFQLVVSWQGDQKEKMFLYLNLHRGKNENGERKLKLLPFNYEFTLNVLDKNGGSVEKKVPFRQLIDCKDSFLIPDGQNVPKVGFWFQVIESSFDDYLINDALYIKYTVHL